MYVYMKGYNLFIKVSLTIYRLVHENVANDFEFSAVLLLIDQRMKF